MINSQSVNELKKIVLILTLVLVGGFTQNVYAQEGAKNNDNAFISKALSFLPEGSRIREYLEETLGIYVQSLQNFDGESNENTVNVKNQQGAFNGNSLQQQIDAQDGISAEDANAADDIMGITGKIKMGMSQEEGYALIDKVLSNIPEGSRAHDLFTEYVDAFKTNARSLEMVGEEADRQSQ